MSAQQRRRAAVVLFAGGFSIVETAALLRVPVDTVHDAIRKALR